MPFAIRQTRHFYGPKTVKSYVTDAYRNDERAEFATRAEAQSTADTLDNATYHLGHNESSRPDFKVVRVRGGK